MMYIIVRAKKETLTFEWHTGDRNPVRPIYTDLEIEDASVFVQADCDELAYIMREFPTLPTCRHSVQKWGGDFAKFIVMNLY